MQSRQQRRYGAILREYGSILAPHLKEKELWSWAKSITPHWPRGSNGQPLSTKEINEDALKQHCDYIVHIAQCRQKGGCKGRVDGHQIDEGIWEVCCSKCGIWTKRKLTPERERELVAIIEGESEEQMEPISASFICDYCFNQKLRRK